jgi:hypothetical protein
MSANDIQIGGQHYRGENIQHWDWAKNMPYLEARCTAYIARHRDKNGIEDIKKSLHFIQKILEERYGATLTWSLSESVERAEAE